MKRPYFLIALFVLFGCETSVSQSSSEEFKEDFNNYWYTGKAEITSYKLTQARYGEIHQGTSVLVYVTEPFSKSKQVKLDDWRNPTDDNVSVLKLNMTKKFLTGIYPYSMMMSSFTPVSSDRYPKTIKVTTSSQEWCGHTWMQLSLVGEHYNLKGYSYFESEGDVDLEVENVLLEDELWSKIRLNPANLPQGDVQLLPGTLYLRLKHKDLTEKNAKASLSQLDNSEFSDAPHSNYSILYKDRTLSIYFESDFPHTILGWEETYRGVGAEKQTTKAKRISTIKSSYWGKNQNTDRELRKELGLSTE